MRCNGTGFEGCLITSLRKNLNMRLYGPLSFTAALADASGDSLEVYFKFDHSV